MNQQERYESGKVKIIATYVKAYKLTQTQINQAVWDAELGMESEGDSFMGLEQWVEPMLSMFENYLEAAIQQ